MDIVTLFFVVVLYIVFAVVLLYVVFGGFIYGAMWMPLPEKRVKRMLELANLTKDKVAYDLGAGFGNVAFKVAILGFSVVAVEADPFKAWWIRHQIEKKKLKNVTLIKANLLDVNLSNADVLLCYLSDGLMDKIVKKPLKKDVAIISACHKIQKWKPTSIDKDSIYPIYIYKVPL